MPERSDTTDALRIRERELWGRLEAISGRRGIRPVILSAAETLSLQREYDELLAVTDPDSIARQYILKQREVAEGYTDQSKMCQMIREFTAFDSEHLWDWHGDYPFLSDGLTYPFSLWLISIAEPRRIAVEKALLHHKWCSVASHLTLPVTLGQNESMQRWYDTIVAITGFVRR